MHVAGGWIVITALDLQPAAAATTFNVRLLIWLLRLISRLLLLPLLLLLLHLQLLLPRLSCLGRLYASRGRLELFGVLTQKQRQLLFGRGLGVTTTRLGGGGRRQVVVRVRGRRVKQVLCLMRVLRVAVMLMLVGRGRC